MIFFFKYKYNYRHGGRTGLNTFIWQQYKEYSTQSGNHYVHPSGATLGSSNLN